MGRLVIPCLSQLLELVQAGQPELASLQEPLLLLVSQVTRKRHISDKNNYLLDMTEFFFSIGGSLFDFSDKFYIICLLHFQLNVL
jgi:hypothetical protein